MTKFDILGVKVSAIDMEDARVFIEEAIQLKRKSYICTCPVSTIMECKKNKTVLASVNSAGLVTPDGMPVVWLGKMKGYSNVQRVYGPDLLLESCRVSERKGYRNYFYGSGVAVLESLQKNLRNTFPSLVISGAYSPPFRQLSEAEDEGIIKMINNSDSDILWVGLGSPKQDIWMYEHRDILNVPVIIGVGAAFDFIAGTKKQAPKLMQKIGMEWLFRLATEPRRLWKRYILGNTQFLYLICKETIEERYFKKGGQV